MTTIPFYTPVETFLDGNVLSATQLNQLLTNLDAVYGLSRRPSIGQTYGRNNVDSPIEWRGWVAYRGNVLVVYVDEACDVEFDATDKHQKRVFTTTSAGLKVFPLPASYGYSEFECYCVRIVNQLAPRYAYMSKNDTVGIPALPFFANGTVVNANNLNVIRSATELLAEQFNQPIVAGSRWSSGMDIPSWLNEQNDYSIEFWAEYRHPRFEYYATATPGSGSSGPVDTIKWEVTGNTGGFDDFDVVSVPRPDPLIMTTPRNVALPTWNLTVGNWYKFRFSHDANGGDGKSTLYWYGQTPSTSLGAWESQERWAMGGIVNGDAGNPPRLGTMNDNLLYLDSRRFSTNPVMRESTQINNIATRTEIVFSRRVHRWLAYENDFTYTTPTLLYTTEKMNVFSAVTLKVSYTTAYFDLDKSPIKPGMVFYVLNCKYAIQVSDVP